MNRIMVCAAARLQYPLKAVRFPLVGIQEGFVFRTKSNELRAFANVCAHRGIELDFDGDGDYFEEGTIRCKAHDARFDIDSGKCLKGPRDCVGKKQLKALQAFEENGMIYVSGIPASELDFRKDFRVNNSVQSPKDIMPTSDQRTDK